jgi:hypothetical protein
MILFSYLVSRLCLLLNWVNWSPGLKVKILEAQQDVLEDEAAGQL